MSDNDQQNDQKNDAQTDDPTRLADDAPAVAADPVAEAKMEAEKFRNEYLYLRAEFENFKRQAIKERSDMRKYGSERLVSDLLNVLDILETALSTEVSHTQESLANFRKGIEMTAKELKATMQRHGVEEAPAQGVPFDPAVHEALSSEESDLPQGTITRVFKKPYKLHDRVVRPGQVVVAKPKS